MPAPQYDRRRRIPSERARLLYLCVHAESVAAPRCIGIPSILNRSEWR